MHWGTINHLTEQLRVVNEVNARERHCRVKPMRYSEAFRKELAVWDARMAETAWVKRARHEQVVELPNFVETPSESLPIWFFIVALAMFLIMIAAVWTASAH